MNIDKLLELASKATPGPRENKLALNRFWEKVDKRGPSECREWQKRSERRTSNGCVCRQFYP